MLLVDLTLHTAILWFLITFFTRSTSADRSLIQTMVVVGGMFLVGIVSEFALRPAIGFFTMVIELAALYWLVDKSCETNRKTTIKICLWYLVCVFSLRFLFELAKLMVNKAA